MALQDTLDAADAVAALLIASGDLTESITYVFKMIPEFDPKVLAALTEPASGQVFPSQLTLERASRVHDSEDHVVEVGIGRLIADEDANLRLHITTVEEVKNVIRDEDNQLLTLPGDGNSLSFLGIEVVLFVPELLRKRVALSVVRVTYRGYV